MSEPSAKILVLEDEKNVGSTLVDRLGHEGFSVSWAQSVEEAKEHLTSSRPELALLDVGLPDGSGFDFAATLRSKHPSTAIVFLTAFGTPEDRVRGLELGAEDYIAKPFHLKEILLRIRNALKRAKYFSGLSETSDRLLKVGEAEVDFSEFSISRGDDKHTLTHKECQLLKLFIERRGKVVSRDEILNLVWSENEMPSSRTIDNFVVRLRKWVEADPENPIIIKSIRGVGYQLGDL